MFTSPRSLIPLVVATLAFAALPLAADAQTFTAKLTGASQLPDPVDTKAEGTLDLTVSADGKSIAYKLSVKDLSNASGADIHLGSAFSNGPVVVKIFPGKGQTAKKGPFTGILAEGSFDAGDMIGPMAGSPLSDLIDELKAGNVYTNVHTNDGVDPPNSGPGDYRLGEIRGQIK